jgi:hypothetical protein
VLVFDGNSAALNLIQEAKNGKEKSRIYVNTRSRDLAAKAKMLEGYVYPLTWEAVLQELESRNATLNKSEQQAASV